VQMDGLPLTFLKDFTSNISCETGTLVTDILAKHGVVALITKQGVTEFAIPTNPHHHCSCAFTALAMLC